MRNFAGNFEEKENSPSGRDADGRKGCFGRRRFFTIGNCASYRIKTTATALGARGCERLKMCPFLDSCGPVLHFLSCDHILFRNSVVRFRISCLVTTCFFGSLWSGFAFLVLGPYAFSNPCGPILLFLPWDHMLFWNPVVRLCISCLVTTCLSRALWSGFAFLALGPHPALKTVFRSPFFIDSV